jgi:hypothetical protein
MEGMARDPNGGGSGDLPPSLAGKLSPELRSALDHRIRRQILRALAESDSTRRSGDLATAIRPPASVSVVSYHLQVLQRSGTLVVEDATAAQAGKGAGYVSTVSDDTLVRSVLQAVDDS